MLANRDHLKYGLKLIHQFKPDYKKGDCILDLGCGDSELVYSLLQSGHDAYGCDIKFKKGVHVSDLEKNNRIKLLDENMKLPFENNSFDIILSFQVLEHVMDYELFAKESKRVLKNNGVAIHVFPSTLRPMESHIFVPLGAFIKNKKWYYLFTCLGFHKKSQRGMTKQEVAEINYNYIVTKTNYLSRKKIREIFKKEFFRVEFMESSYFNCSQHKALKMLAKFPRTRLLGFLYSVFWRRVLITSKN